MRYMLLCFFLLVSTFFPMSSAIVHAKEQILTPDLVLGQSAILIDATTGTVLFQKNSEVPMYPASITKIATGIFAIETGKLDDIVTVSKNARYVDGTRVYLAEGEQVPMKKLIYGLLMHSGNDAAIAIAEHMAGSTEVFANEMMKYLKERVQLEKTNFTNPHGLHETNHYTTATDMAKIAQYAMRNPLFREIVATKRLPWDGKEWKSELVNHNKMLVNYEGATGIKNGFTDQARHTLVVSAKRENSEFIAVTMSAPSSGWAYRDVTKMLDFAFANYETVQAAKSGERFTASTEGQKPLEVEYFFTDKPLFVTVRKGASIERSISSSGHLTVRETGASKEVLSTSFPLQSKQVPQVSESRSDLFSTSDGEASNETTLYLIFGGWLALNCSMVFGFLSRKKRTTILERRSNNRFDS